MPKPQEYIKTPGGDALKAFVDVSCPQCGPCGRITAPPFATVRMNVFEFERQVKTAMTALIDGHEKASH